MKNILKFTSLLGFLALVGVSQAHAQAACFYEHDDYQGRSYCINANQSINDFQNLGFNDAVSSIRVAPGYTVNVCVDNNMQGGCRQFSQDIRSLNAYGLNDKISSAQVYYRSDDGYPSGGRKEACFYDDSGYGGRGFCLNRGQVIYNLGTTQFNDTISSLTVAPGLKVFVCEHKDFGGRCLRIKRNIRNLTNFNFNDLISSIQVR